MNEAISSNEYEAFSEHYLLFNGVYMRVHGSIVKQIAGLPEVSAIRLHTIAEPPAKVNALLIINIGQQ